METENNQANDPNYVAYQKAVNSGQFKDVESGTFVAFSEGQFVGMGVDRDKLFQELTEKGIEGFSIIKWVFLKELCVYAHLIYYEHSANNF